MDLEIQTTVQDLTAVLKDLGFSIESKGSYISAIKKNARGRMHAAFVETEEGVYCDLHYDYHVHFLLIGVDYKEKPKRYFENNIKAALKQKGVEFDLRMVNWFTRRNKAVFRGFRL